MTNRFLADVSLGKRAEQWLLENGYDVLIIRSINPSMPDSEILALAVTQNRMVITIDKDFGELVYRSGQSHRGVLLLRLETETSVEKVRVLSHILTTYSDQMENMFCVYQNGQLRIRQ